MEVQLAGLHRRYRLCRSRGRRGQALPPARRRLGRSGLRREESVGTVGDEGPLDRLGGEQTGQLRLTPSLSFRGLLLRAEESPAPTNPRKLRPFPCPGGTGDPTCAAAAPQAQVQVSPLPLRFASGTMVRGSE